MTAVQVVITREKYEGIKIRLSYVCESIIIRTTDTKLYFNKNTE